MVQMRSILNVADNTGAKKLMVIGVLGRGNRRVAYVGDVVSAVVKKAAPLATVKKHEKIKAVIVRSRKEIGRSDGSYIRFDENAAVIINSLEDKNPKGTRIFGPIARELKDLNFTKIVSMAREVF